MSDLISRSKLIDHLNACLAESDGGTPITDAVIVAIRSAVENMPSVDAVPAVRCRECRHWGKHDVDVPGETDSIKACEWAIWMIGENGYCVYGERKEKL